MSSWPPTPLLGERDRVGVLSRGINRIPHLAALLGAPVTPFPTTPAGLTATVGWGYRHTAAAAHAFAATHGLRYLRLEDGFVRSVGLGVTGTPPLSIVLDDLGIYYDARTPSRLEALITNSVAADAAELARARRAIDRIVAGGLSKYNDAPPTVADLGPRTGRRVLVVDQTFGDRSVEDGLATAATFGDMLAAARADHPGAEIIIKTHPDVLAGKRRGYLQHARGGNLRMWAQPGSPIELARQVDAVYVVTSQLGFEARLAGTPVVCFGAPFYAGWGLTDDRADVPRRGVTRSLEQVFAAAYLRYPRYVDPDDGTPCELERVLDHVELQRAMFATNTGRIFGVGFLPWKRTYVRDYLRCPGNQVRFVYGATHARRLGFAAGDHLLVLGHRDTPAVRDLAASHGVPIWRMEDGFLRSVGLGSNATRPASLVVDRLGIYYDPSQPSDLEHLLQTATFTADELARAAALRSEIVARRISKYNVGDDAPLQVPPGRRVVLVPGQVEDDASIRQGAGAVRTNLGLLAAARRACPDAYIIFKPHPDVLGGNRVGVVPDDIARQHADHVETTASLARCLDACHEVHTMTSLVGFEALLRGHRVVVYGQPFYAGWGLTHDLAPHPRRGRPRTLDELVAAAMLRYPRYVNPTTRQFTTPEAILRLLDAGRATDADGGAAVVPWWRRNLRRARNVVEELIHG